MPFLLKGQAFFYAISLYDTLIVNIASAPADFRAACDPPKIALPDPLPVSNNQGDES